ncbi:MAG: hypothetical protein RL213_420 [Bacteroidota bacterium]|jgi:GAF domain-containing protein
MAEMFTIPVGAGRAERYKLLQAQLPSLLDPAFGRMTNAANTVAAMMEALRFHWIGFYFVSDIGGSEELLVGPYQGPVACARIGFGKGVCGSAWQNRQTIVVPDVELFPGHIACSAASKSEIVVPVFRQTTVIGVLDIDSALRDDFTQEDRAAIERIVAIVSPCL